MAFATVANFISPLASGAIAAFIVIFSVSYYVFNKDNQEVRFRLKSVYQSSPILFVVYFVLFRLIDFLSIIPLIYIIYHSYKYPRISKNTDPSSHKNAQVGAIGMIGRQYYNSSDD